MEYTCVIDEKRLLCSITADRALTKPVFCFAAMAPITVIDGGERIKHMGGYSELALPDLKAYQPHVFTLAYTDDLAPANRAWMPLGPYLRVGGECINLPKLSRGVNTKAVLNSSPSDTADTEGKKSATDNFSNKLRLAPQPRSWTPSQSTVHISSVRINSLDQQDAAMQTVADLAQRRNFEPLFTPGGTALNLNHAAMPNDAYRMDISPDGLVITSGSYGGRFYAGITLLTLIRLHDGYIPCGCIEDTPKFSWRGQHLDTARHFYQIETILDLLDLMALLKLNRFHWHFADDEAFRLQLDCCPELWQRTSMRGEGHLLPGLFSGEIESGGSYSKNDARKLIAHAKAMNIEIMPEIETPAHALALTHVYPDTRDPDDTGGEISVQGYAGNILNPAMPKTWEVLENIVTEVGELFPFNHIHLGCDELPADTWSGSPKAHALMDVEGLQTRDDLLGWTMSRLADTVEKNGQRSAAWEEAALGSNGGIGHSAILFSWTGLGPGLQGARAGYDVVMCPAQHVYLDMAHTPDTDDWGANWAAYISLADTIDWDVIPDTSVANNIIGVQGTYWSEFTTSDEQIWPMLMPRIIGVASKAWQSDQFSAEFLSVLAQTYQQRLWNLSVDSQRR